MIEGRTHKRAARIVKKLPEHLQAKIESPKPGRRFVFLGREAVVSQLEVSVAAEPDHKQVLPQMITDAFARSKLIRQDRGRGGIARTGGIPLMYEGNITQPGGRRLLSFIPNTWR